MTEQYTSTIIEDHQPGFNKCHSTTDQILILKEATIKYWEYSNAFFGNCIHFRKLRWFK